MKWSSMMTEKQELHEKGLELISFFCDQNNLPNPKVTVSPLKDWFVGSCAYYRASTGISICLETCSAPGTELQVRNWNWPGNTTDRTPYGVLCHELGHHVDVLAGKHKFKYSSEVSAILREDSGEKPISGYAPNDAEWFAEMFRLFVTNSQLLKLLRPRTYDLFERRWMPVSATPWEAALAPGCPDRILHNLKMKVLQ